MKTQFNSSVARILLIDDSTADLQVLMEIITCRRYRLAVAFDGNDGYRKALLSKPDLILLDVRMPGMDGFSTCRLLKANEATKHIPVIFLTAANDPNERVSGLTLGAVDYIAKPIVSEEEVLARIAIHLDIARRLGSAQMVRSHVSGEAGADLVSATNRALVSAATGYIQEHLADPPSPLELARMLGTNERKLNEAFRSVLSLPVFGWLREERMCQARHLLTHTETPVREIGEHLGYPNAANFSTAFRERFGTSPRDFRAALRQRLQDDSDGCS